MNCSPIAEFANGLGTGDGSGIVGSHCGGLSLHKYRN